jgi:hypothetical protein
MHKVKDLLSYSDIRRHSYTLFPWHLEFMLGNGREPDNEIYDIANRVNSISGSPISVSVELTWYV